MPPKRQIQQLTKAQEELEQRMIDLIQKSEKKIMNQILEAMKQQGLQLERQVPQSPARSSPIAAKSAKGKEPRHEEYESESESEPQAALNESPLEMNKSRQKPSESDFKVAKTTFPDYEKVRNKKVWLRMVQDWKDGKHTGVPVSEEMAVSILLVSVPMTLRLQMEDALSRLAQSDGITNHWEAHFAFLSTQINESIDEWAEFKQLFEKVSYGFTGNTPQGFVNFSDSLRAAMTEMAFPDKLQMLMLLQSVHPKPDIHREIMCLPPALRPTTTDAMFKAIHTRLVAAQSRPQEEAKPKARKFKNKREAKNEEGGGASTPL